MVRIRSSLRRARQEKNGLWEAGYQYRRPQEVLFSLGPWDSVQTMEEHDVPRNALQHLHNGVLSDGVILPVWSRIDSTIANQQVLGADELVVVNKRYSLIFVQDTADGNKIKIKWNDGTNSGTFDTTIVGSAVRIASAAWQNYVYWTQPALGALYRFDPALLTNASVAGGPDAKFLFIVHDHLLAIRENGNVFDAKWSVNGDPTDWAGAGSGLHAMSILGKVNGAGKLKDSIVVLGGKTALWIEPTSSLPSFTFRDLPQIDGTPFDHGVASSGDAIYYASNDRDVIRFDGGPQEKVGEGEAAIVKTPILYYSYRLGLLIVTVKEDSKTYFLNIQTKKWVQDIDEGFDFFSDLPATSVLGKVVALKNSGSDYVQAELDLDPTTFTIPEFTTGKYVFENEYYIEYIDLLRTSNTLPKPPGITIDIVLRNGVEDSLIFDDSNVADVVEMEQRVRYFINRMALGFKLVFSSIITEGPFRLDQALTAGGNINVTAANDIQGSRADLNLSGNAVISTSATGYISDGDLNVAGNMELEIASSGTWPRNNGIKRIDIMLVKERDEQIVAA